MKRLAIIVALCLFGACGTDDDASQSSVPTTTTTKSVVSTDPPLNDFVERVTIDGMPCLVWKDKIDNGSSSYAYSGLTCDWSDR